MSESIVREYENEASKEYEDDRENKDENQRAEEQILEEYEDDIENKDEIQSPEKDENETSEKIEDGKENEDKLQRAEEIVDESDLSYKDKIRKALDMEISRPENFACGGVLQKVELELIIKGIGKIILPLSSEQGTIIKDKCAAAPFGRGSKTYVDKKVRDAWIMDAKDVILNDNFNKLIDLKMADIFQYFMGDINTNAKIKSLREEPYRVELYKLVYYEKGGFFVPHRDTEKTPGMFATLVVQLPAGHKGGELVVKHGRKTKVFGFDYFSRNNYFYTAFYSDCEHELKQITDGHRIVLIYNIIFKNPHSMLHSNRINKKFISIMKNYVDEWKKDNKCPYLVLKLDHLYTDSLSFNTLKGNDKKIADALRSYSGFEVFLATITKYEIRIGAADSPEPYRSEEEEEEDDENEDEDEDEDEYEDEEMKKMKMKMNSDDILDVEENFTLSDWINVNNELIPFGEQILDNNAMLIDYECLFDEDDEYDEEGETEYLGNEGNTQEFTYKKICVVFCPKEHGILKANVLEKKFNEQKNNSARKRLHE